MSIKKLQHQALNEGEMMTFDVYSIKGRGYFTKFDTQKDVVNSISAIYNN